MKQFNITVTANGETAFDGLATPGMTFGRRPTNDCTIPERSVSGTHARLVAVGGELHIEDLGSGNKTRIQNGVTLGEGEQAMLVHGMVIAMGRARVEVSIVGKDAEDPEQTLLQTDDLAPPAPPRSEPKQQNPPTQELPLPALRTVKSPIYDSESIETKVGPEPVISAARESGISTKPTDRGQGMAASEPAPSVPSGSSVRTIGYQTGHSEEVAEKTSAAGLELLRSMRPRLVFDDDAMREIVSIDTVEIMIGRSR
ncbi:MAG: pSer/pThr/pTyr-binding forkhead associated (FHA) protein, partial [Planctomycetota bacterium]